MKKLLAFFALASIMAHAVSAQNSRPFRFGLTASPSIAWFKPETNDYSSKGSILGFSYGLVGDFHLGEFYAVSTGLNITYAGGKLGFIERIPDVGITDLERDYRLQYLELPVAIKMHTPQIGYFTYYGKFGLAPGVNLKSTAKDTYVSGNIFTVEYDNKRNTPLFRAALIVGLGTEYSFGGRTSVFGGLTYNNGFSNVLKGRNQLTSVKPNAMSNYVMINLGVLF